MKFNIREIVTIAFLATHISLYSNPTAEEIAAVRELIRCATGRRLQSVEVEILLMAEQIAARHNARLFPRLWE